MTVVSEQLLVESAQLELDILLDLPATRDLAKLGPDSFEQHFRQNKILLERWKFCFRSKGKISFSQLRHQLPQIYKYLTVLFRSLFMYCHWVPSAGVQAWLGDERDLLRYEVSMTEVAQARDPAVTQPDLGVEAMSYHLDPVEAPFGTFQAGVTYRNPSFYLIEASRQKVQTSTDSDILIPAQDVKEVSSEAVDIKSQHQTVGESLPNPGYGLIKPLSRNKGQDFEDHRKPRSVYLRRVQNTRSALSEDNEAVPHQTRYDICLLEEC